MGLWTFKKKIFSGFENFRGNCNDSREGHCFWRICFLSRKKMTVRCSGKGAGSSAHHREQTIAPSERAQRFVFLIAIMSHQSDTPALKKSAGFCPTKQNLLARPVTWPKPGKQVWDEQMQVPGWTLWSGVASQRRSSRWLSQGALLPHCSQQSQSHCYFKFCHLEGLFWLRCPGSCIYPLLFDSTPIAGTIETIWE